MGFYSIRCSILRTRRYMGFLKNSIRCSEDKEIRGICFVGLLLLYFECASILFTRAYRLFLVFSTV